MNTTPKLPSPEDYNAKKPVFVWLLNGQTFEFDTLEEAVAEIRDQWICGGNKAARHAVYWIVEAGEWQRVNPEAL